MLQHGLRMKRISQPYQIYPGHRYDTSSIKISKMTENRNQGLSYLGCEIIVLRMWQW